jgi:hypothetical protein
LAGLRAARKDERAQSRGLILEKAIFKNIKIRIGLKKFIKESIQIVR